MWIFSTAATACILQRNYKKVNSKTNPREEFQLEGYGMPLDSAIGRIIRYAINSKYGKDEITTLKEYLNVFKQIKEEIYKEVGR